MDDITGIVERMRMRAVEEAAEIAALPCASCGFNSEQAKACRFNERAVGCKHTGEVRRIQDVEARAQGRARNLINAGLERNMVADPQLQLVCRDELEPRTAILAVKRALHAPTLRFLVLGGPHRTGKTMGLFYACSVAASACYIRAQQLGRIDQDHDRWKSCSILAINELGREQLGKNGFAEANLDELMAEREYGAKLTIFATNLPLAAEGDRPSLVKRYGDLFASRIAPPIGAYVTCKEDAGGDVAPVSIKTRRFDARAAASGEERGTHGD